MRDSENSLKLLIRKRATIKSKLTQYNTFINKSVPDSQTALSSEKIKSRKFCFEHLIKEFDTVQEDIEVLVAEENFEEQTKKGAI